MTWTYPDIGITGDELALAGPVIERTKLEMLDNEVIFSDCLEVMIAGQHSAGYVPIVKMALDGVFTVLEAPSIQDRLPDEVILRRFIAMDVGAWLTNLCLEKDVFGDFYQKSLYGRLYEDPERITAPEAHDNIVKLVMTPFYDASMVCGGAVDLLQREGVGDQEIQSVITASTGLLAISGVDKKKTRVVADSLGFPYTHPDNLVTRDEEEGLKVSFTESAKAFLSGLMIEGRGCPAGKITDGDGSGRTILENVWVRMVNYLVSTTPEVKHPRVSI